jgi:hypothetical protein
MRRAERLIETKDEVAVPLIGLAKAVRLERTILIGFWGDLFRMLTAHKCRQSFTIRKAIKLLLIHHQSTSMTIARVDRSHLLPAIRFRDSHDQLRHQAIGASCRQSALLSDTTQRMVQSAAGSGVRHDDLPEQTAGPGL